MGDKQFWGVIVCLAVMIVGCVVLAAWSGIHEANLRADCNANGGLLIEQGFEYVCIKAKVIEGTN